jgi:uncharacterized protein YbbC (DUF1343 family)
MFVKKLLSTAIFLTSALLLSSCSTFTKSKTHHVKLGIENIDKYSTFFIDKKVGLITNTTGTDSKLTSSIDILKSKTNLVALYSPEHGIRGNAQAGDNVNSNIDLKSGLPVYSLYSSKGCIEPTGEMLKNIDVLCYDIQDIGARFYTYISTMGKAMKACKKYNKTFIVFDRPNPLTGSIVEGRIMQPEFESNVGMYPIPIRYGLTCGELAKMINKKYNINCKLDVIPISNWKRNMFWQDTNLPWIFPSPNIPTPETAVIYSGTCLFEGTNISEGRGTTKPFELIGAPWINAPKLSDSLNSLNLPAVIFSPVYFTPTFSKYKGKICGGVNIHVTDNIKLKSVETAVAMIYTIKEMYKDKFEWRKPVNKKWWIDLLTGSTELRLGNKSYNELSTDWNYQAAQFKIDSEKYFLYK